MKHCLFFLITAIFITSCTKTTSTRGTTALHSISNPDYDKAWKFIDKGDDKNGFIYLDKAKDAYIKAGDSFSAGKSFVNMAIIQERVSDNMGSIETSITALKFLNEKNPNHHGFLSSNYNNMGVASNSLKTMLMLRNITRKPISFLRTRLKKL